MFLEADGDEVSRGVPAGAVGGWWIRVGCRALRRGSAHPRRARRWAWVPWACPHCCPSLCPTAPPDHRLHVADSLMVQSVQKHLPFMNTTQQVL